MRSYFCAAQVVIAPLEQLDAGVDPERATTSGMSLRTSCSCSAIVPVETTTFLPERRRGDEIRERFSDPRSGLDNRVGVLEDAALDEARHLQLTRPRFVSFQRLRATALGAENLLEVNGQRPAVRIRRAVRVPQRRPRPVRRDAAERRVHRSIQTRRSVRRRGLATQSPAR